jgi:hydrogenase maturation factor HypF (carbamoyltransferase family)
VANQFYSFTIEGTQNEDVSSPLVVDWTPAVPEILEDLRHQVPVGTISCKFHNMLVEIIIAIAR